MPTVRIELPVTDFLSMLSGIEIADVRRFGDGRRVPSPCAAFLIGGDCEGGNVPALGASNEAMVNPTPTPAQTEAGDAPLIVRALARDAVALAEIMRRNNRRLYRAAWGILRDEQEAEDAVQDCYLKAFAALSKFRGEASLSTWLTRIAINEALMRRRKRQAQAASVGNVVPLRPEESPAMEPTEDPARSPESAAMRAQLRPYLEHAIGGLPEDQRAVFVLR